MNDFKDKRSRNTECFLKSYGIQKKMATVSGFDETQAMGTKHQVLLSFLPVTFVISVSHSL